MIAPGEIVLTQPGSRPVCKGEVLYLYDRSSNCKRPGLDRPVGVIDGDYMATQEMKAISSFR